MLIPLETCYSECENETLVCTCSICQGDSDKLRIYKNGLVCEDCLDYIRQSLDLEVR